MSEVLAFEQALSEVTTEPLDANRLSKYTVAQMKEKFPFLDWTAFFQRAFKGAGKGDQVGEHELHSLTSDLMFPLGHVHDRSARSGGVHLGRERPRDPLHGREALRPHKLHDLASARSILSG